MGRVRRLLCWALGISSPSRAHQHMAEEWVEDDMPTHLFAGGPIVANYEERLKKHIRPPTLREAWTGRFTRKR